MASLYDKREQIRCRECGTPLVRGEGTNWNESLQQRNDRICKTCRKAQSSEYYRQRKEAMLAGMPMPTMAPASGGDVAGEVVCRACGAPLEPGVNWHKSRANNKDYICTFCVREYYHRRRLKEKRPGTKSRPCKYCGVELPSPYVARPGDSAERDCYEELRAWNREACTPCHIAAKRIAWFKNTKAHPRGKFYRQLHQSLVWDYDELRYDDTSFMDEYIDSRVALLEAQIAERRRTNLGDDDCDEQGPTPEVEPQGTPDALADPTATPGFQDPRAEDPFHGDAASENVPKALDTSVSVIQDEDAVTARGHEEHGTDAPDAVLDALPGEVNDF